MRSLGIGSFVFGFILLQSIAVTNSASACLEDPTLAGCNSCRTESANASCSDPYCTERICEQLDQTQCCEDSWSSDCVELATKICIPEVVPRPSGLCPLGFICHETKAFMSNCSDVRDLTTELYLGDVYGGIYCPKGRSSMINCPIGFYCPTPEEKISCPADFFCPHKSTEPSIKCARCKAEAKKLERYIFGYVVLGIGSALILLAIGISYLRKHKSELFQKQFEMLARQAGGVRLLQHRKERQEQLERLRPKLDIISKRLGKIENTSKMNSSHSTIDAPTDPDSSTRYRSSTLIVVDDGTLVFDAKKIYDALDTDSSGDLSYEELNTVLALDKVQLQNFVERMQALGGKDEESETISRPVFVRYFLKVLEEMGHLQVSPGEAATVYDEIVKENGKGYVDERMLYSSSMSKFLSDQQIYVLIKKFRTVKDKHDVPESSGPKKRPGNLFRMKGSLNNCEIISRSVFINFYPHFLVEVSTNFDESMALSMRPDNNSVVDICFKDLSLAVHVADKSINVVDNVTGRVQAKTMTALMGGSGAGKTSLLNALCGRAFYGEVHGEIHINGQRKDIEEIKDTVGFVPQDDIVYAELTVRENFVYAGRFRLPSGTPMAEIEELADETLANLGLSRVADSLVGDVKRRGVSGGEKKRVNIGLELMARPLCLFLDEPTSGLDSSSALLVMKSLKHLVISQGVTIVCVIHQPRKFIFDLFDSLILLGVGGRMVYHGPTKQAFDYFTALDYILPQGESVSDWLIDISSGRSPPEPEIAATKKLEKRKKKKDKKKRKKEKKNKDEVQDMEVSQGALEVEVISAENDEAVGTKGISTGKAKDAFEEAISRRAILYGQWNDHFQDLSEEDREIYGVPPKTALPPAFKKQSFVSQLQNQVTRALLVSWRNSTSKLIDTAILVIATVVITVTSGYPEMTLRKDPDIKFEDAVSPTEETSQRVFAQLFKYAGTPQWDYPLKIGIIVAVLVGLQATRILTSKRIEFFREASSGYNINAYFAAINIVATVEHSLQIIIVAFFAAWLRDPLANWVSYFVHFLLLAWICVSWALFVPMIFPPDNVVVIVGFFMAFCGLMISGALPPVKWENIYKGGFTEHLSGWLSPTRYFFEGLAVGDYRCLPPQSGLTVDDESIHFNRSWTVLVKVFGMAGHDPNATQQSCGGWYWGVLPSLFVGLTVRFAAGLAMHTFNRSMQTKKPLLFEMKRDKKARFTVVAMIVTLFLLVSLTTWLYTRDIEPNYEFNEEFYNKFSGGVGEQDIQEILDDPDVTSLLDLNALPSSVADGISV